MATATYELIETTTLTSDTSVVTFSNIPQTYRDLVLVGDGTFNDNAIIQFFFGSNFQGIRAYGYVGTTGSDLMPNQTYFWSPVGTSRPNFNFILQIMDYSLTDKHKSAICRAGDDTSAGMAAYTAGTTNAITSLQIRNNSGFIYQMEIGSTFSLYGIAG